MSDTTANLALPYILPSQAQKHVTHNEALQRLDAAVQLVLAAHLATPPEDPSEGACYAITTPTAGAWSGKAGQVALRQDGAWIFLQPRHGWRAYDLANQHPVVFVDGQWTDPPLPQDPTVSTLGVSASADVVNRLAVSSPASLLNHAGSGHQLKINKAGPSDTASLLFQSNWQGCAEFGLAGSDEFAIKVSADGSLWKTALAISADGHVRTAHRPLVRAALADSSFTPANGSQTGFDTLHLQQGGFSLGPALPSGHGSSLVVPADGIYLLSVHLSILTSSGHGLELTLNDSTILATCQGTGGPVTQSLTALAALSAGDRLTLSHTGTAQVQFGYGKTELAAAML
ncbi:DUF2793 domain-containing protein [Agrobacterium sp. a22-2]|uniref:DUF2793 domain-containing protein n=1 Tax=Agrobacterium sp. a22-2 TaxID=2283840 RepID=UPI0014488A85|nr:DUF2793 domain-containing protein [Agrobacterium sp. a22-2]NKN35682.1 DUF2793 domain-containing protein [Agrobacterium sp. a22-2]